MKASVSTMRRKTVMPHAGAREQKHKDLIVARAASLLSLCARRNAAGWTRVFEVCSPRPLSPPPFPPSLSTPANSAFWDVIVLRVRLWYGEVMVREGARVLTFSDSCLP